MDRQPVLGERLMPLLFVTLFALMASAPCLAVSPAYLSEFPDPARVAKDFEQGSDRMDTLAHQVAALDRLYQIAGEMAGDRKFQRGPDQFPNAAELELRSRIGKVADPLRAAAQATFDPKVTGFDTPRAKWLSRVHGYETSPDLLDELMQRYFSPGFRDTYASTTGTMARVREQSAKTMRRDLRSLNGQGTSRWEEMSGSEQRNLLLAATAMVALLSLGLRRQLRSGGSVPADRNKLRAGFDGHSYDWATGTLTDYSARKEEQKHIQLIGANKNRDSSQDRFQTTPRTSESYTTTVHEKFSLVYEGGRTEVAVNRDWAGQVTATYFKDSEKHRVTALWFRKGSAEWEYLAFRDWTTGRNLEHPAARRLISRSSAGLWTFLPAIGLGYLAGRATDLVPFFDGRPRSVLMALTFGAVWFVVQLVLGTLEQRRSERQLRDILLAIGPDDAAPAKLPA